MKQIIVSAFGGIEVLKLRELPVPEPGKGEARVRVITSAISGADINMRRGTYPKMLTPPFTPGYSIIGEIDKNGSGATRFAKGQRVACLTVIGGQSQFIILPESLLHLVPDGVDPVLAVALVLDGMTAYQMISRKVRLQKGAKVFIHGASGAVGALLSILARRMGLRALGTGSPGKHADLKKMGVEPFDYRQPSFVEAVRNEGGVDAVFDPLGYESFDLSYSMLRKGGTIVGYGFNGSTYAEQKRSIMPSFLKLFARNLIPDGKHATFYSINRKSAHFAEDQAELFRMLASGEIQPPIRALFSLTEVPEAHAYWAGGGQGIGSIVIRVS